MSKFLIFPPKNLEKLRAPKIRVRHFFFFYFLCQPLFKIFIFPPKNLEKIRMRRFFFYFFPLLILITVYYYS